MPAKKQTKSRTSNSKANKKISAPRWVIAVVLLIVAGTGAFLVYNSFAGKTYSGYDVKCYQGKCQYAGKGQGNQGNRTCYPAYGSKSQFGYLCKY